MELHTDKAASKREQNESSLSSAEREQAQTHRVQLMMLDIDGVLTQHKATPTDVLTAAQALAVSAIGDLTNKTYQTSAVSPQTSAVSHQTSAVSPQTSAVSPQTSAVSPQTSAVSPQTSDSLHRLADGIADQIRAALHLRINEGWHKDW